jgi:hypothetical protein
MCAKTLSKPAHHTFWGQSHEIPLAKLLVAKLVCLGIYRAPILCPKPQCAIGLLVGTDAQVLDGSPELSLHFATLKSKRRGKVSHDSSTVLWTADLQPGKFHELTFDLAKYFVERRLN